MTERYQGACPVCGLTLVIAEGNGNRLDCVSGHYSASRHMFERVWDELNWNVFQSIKALGSKETDELLAKLDAINQVEISPEEVKRLREKALGS